MSSRFRRFGALLAISLSVMACSSDDGSTDSTSPVTSATGVTTAGTEASSGTTNEAEPSDATTAPAPSVTEAGVTTPDTAAVAPTPTADAAPPAVGFPVTVIADNGEIVIDDRPAAIISLSPTATEILFAIGAGDQVLAVDNQSNFPAEAAAKSSDLSGFEPNVEAIAGMKPDLVVIADDTKALSASLGQLGINTIYQPPVANLDGAYVQIAQLGKATGHDAEAEALVLDMQSKVGEILAGVKPPAAPVRVFHEVDNTGYSATSATFIGEVYTLLGLQNIADLVEDTSGYPQLSIERIISADPQIIFLGDTLYGESKATVAARPGWDVISAVKTGNVIELDSDVASRWGPRTVDLIRQVADALAALGA